MQPNSDFKDLLSILNEEKVKYLIVGGYAVMHHTEPRYTKDLDIWISTEHTNATSVYASLRRFGAPLEGITVEDFETPDLVYQLGRPPARVDIIMGLKGVGFEECWNRRVQADFGGVMTYFISREDLVINKRVLGRPQDIIDVESLSLSEQVSGNWNPPAT